MSRNVKTSKKNLRDEHVKKNHAEQLAYYNSLKIKNSAPTAEQKHDFKATDQSKDSATTLETVPQKQKRPKTLGQIFADYWAQTLVSIITFVLLGFLVYGRIFDAKADVRIATNEKNIGKIEKNIEELNERNQKSIKKDIEKLTTEISNVNNGIKNNNTKIETIATNVINLKENISEIKEDIREIRSVNNNIVLSVNNKARKTK